jgi:hypothetical protein
MRFLRRLVVVQLTFALSSLTHSASAQSLIDSDQAWGAAIAGLRMAISLTKPGTVPNLGAEFYVAFQNIGDKDVVLNLGAMLGNGALQWPQAVRLMLTDPQGNSRKLQFVDRGHPAVAGRLDDFIVALRIGAIYILRLNLEQYQEPGGYPLAALRDGHYRITSQFEGVGAKLLNGDTPGVALLHFWTGTLQSNSLDFDVSGDADRR